ncbi:MAG: hypothetical protein ABSG91_08390 [Syntrophobacteraceae bacterium]
MANSDQQKSSFTPGLIIVLAGVIGALALRTTILETSRPGTPEPKSHACQNPQNVDAKLWEDPFACILKGHREGIHCTKLKKVYADLITPSSNKIEIFGVLIDGTPYAGSAETRRRARYAVSSALHTFGFFPRDPNRIGIGVVPYNQDGGSGGKAGCENSAESSCEGFRIPFEVFQSSRSDEGPVLVLWISEDQLGGYPLRRLHGILRNVNVVGDGDPKWEEFLEKVKFIGPETSGILKSMIEEISKARANERSSGNGPLRPPLRRLHEILGEVVVPRTSGCEEFLEKLKFIGPETSATFKSMSEVICQARIDERSSGNRLLPLPLGHYKTLFEKARFYSPTATAEDKFLLEKAPGTERKDIVSFLKDCFAMAGDSNSWEHLVRTTLSDDKLAEALVEELVRRGVDISGKSHIVLLSEWDTAYGRALPLSIRRAIKQKAKDKDPERVRIYSYPSGLDGQKSTAPTSTKNGDKEEGEADRSKKTEKEAEKEAAIENVIAEGNGQFDYLKRLQTNIENWQNLLKREHPTQAVDAIGVFGTDSFDKLLILRALRPYFPGTVFFTTDLDAVLLHPKESKWARNLVVASSFGFELHPDLQKEIFPFRSSSQTAQYLATYIALHDLYHPAEQFTQDKLNECLEARIFEIGNTKAIDLPLGKEPTARQCTPLSEQKIDSLYPQRPPGTQNPFYHYLIGLILLIFLLCVSMPALITWIKNEFFCVTTEGGHKPSLNPAAILALVLIGATSLLTYLVYQARFEEPFYWLEGVSIWPTEIIRVAAFWLALAFIVHGWRKLRNSERKLARDYFPKIDSSESKMGLAASLFKMGNLRKILFYERSCRNGGSNGIKDPSGAWRHYMEQSRPINRLIRVFVGGALYWALAMFIVFFFGRPHAPTRGNIAIKFDFWTLNLLIVAFIFLLFFVIDSTRLCKFMANRLTDDTEWEEVARGRKVEDRNLDPQSKKEDMNHAIDSWTDVEFFAKLSEPVSKLIYYPFIILAAAILARSNVFARWETPVALLFVFTCSALFSVYCALMLRNTAERIRRQSLEKLKDILIAAKGDKENQAGSNQLEVLIQRVELMNQGAFAPFLQQPAIRAFLFPLGSLGSAALLGYLPHF